MSKAKGKAKQRARQQKGKPTQKKDLWLVDLADAVTEHLFAAPGCAFDRHRMVARLPERRKEEE